MSFISILYKKLEYFYNQNSLQKLINHLINYYFSIKLFFSSLFHLLVLHAKPFLLHISYFLVVTVFGYLALKISGPRVDHISTNLDLFFTSASATTVASLTTVEMEVLSNAQLVIMGGLIFLGSEIFISLLALQFRRLKYILYELCKNRGHLCIEDQAQGIELGVIPNQTSLESDRDETKFLYNSIKSLRNVVAGYLLIGHVLGTSLIFMYIGLTTSAQSVLEKKGLDLQTFCVFTAISSFTNCGFIPTNENMIVFRNNPGLLLILTPLSVIGGALFPPCLRLVIWVMERFTKRKEYTYMLENYKELKYSHLMSRKECWLLVATFFTFLSLQFGTFCIMEWSSGVMDGMSSYEKVVGSFFQTANVRHTGESIVDLSVVSSAISVIFVVMMYFPPYTSYMPIVNHEEEASSQSYKSKKGNKKKNNIIQNLLWSQLSYLTIFVILICFTERKSLKEDPLNFNLLSIVFEVVSAYGSVGLSMGYSCKRRLNGDEICVDKSYSLAGWFSKEGKFTLILAMFYGRLKKFNIHSGQAWRLA